MKNKYTITIGVPAHNEEKTIASLIDSILIQNETNFVLEHIYVACDGCTDNTAQVADSYDKVEVINDGLRKGQAGRLSDFFKSNDSDIFITFDADVVLENENVISEIVNHFKDDKVGIVGGSPIPFVPVNFVQRFIVTWLQIWYYARKSFNNGRNINNHNGKISAVAKLAVIDLVIPNDIYANDDFLYISIINRNFAFEFCPKARVLYSVPDNFKDYFLQHGRFITLKKNIIEHFGKDVANLYVIPRNYKINALFKVFIRHPINTVTAIACETYLRLFKDKIKEKYEGVSWTAAESTKKHQTITKGAF